MKNLAWRVSRVTKFFHLVHRNGSIQFVVAHITIFVGLMFRIVLYNVFHKIALSLKCQNGNNRMFPRILHPGACEWGCILDRRLCLVWVFSGHT